MKEGKNLIVVYVHSFRYFRTVIIPPRTEVVQRSIGRNPIHIMFHHRCVISQCGEYESGLSAIDRDVVQSVGGIGEGVIMVGAQEEGGTGAGEYLEEVVVSEGEDVVG